MLVSRHTTAKILATARHVILLAVAEVITGTKLGLAMVEDGQAFAYRNYLAQCDSREYLEAEFRASRHRYGVWQVPGGITRPWDFRRGRTSARPGIDSGSALDGRR